MDIEGVVCKCRRGTHQIGGSMTSWLKVKTKYSQAEGDTSRLDHCSPEYNSLIAYFRGTRRFSSSAQFSTT